MLLLNYHDMQFVSDKLIALVSDNIGQGST